MADQPYRLLLSYAYYGNEQDLEAMVTGLGIPVQVFADSGAYTADTMGRTITVDEYAAWIERWNGLFESYANLDVIGDPEATRQNQQAMEAVGLSPLPVFHGGEPAEYLHGYLDRHDYIGLGGMVAHSTAAAIRWCAQCFLAGRSSATRFHGFGQTNLRILKALPWYSVDSSSWGSAHRYGNVLLWDDRTARWCKVNVGDHASVYGHAALVRSHNGDPAVLARPSCGFVREGVTIEDVREERATISAMSLTAWRRLEAWLSVWHNSPFRIYFAEAHWRNFVPAITGAQAHTP